MITQVRIKRSELVTKMIVATDTSAVTQSFPIGMVPAGARFIDGPDYWRDPEDVIVCTYETPDDPPPTISVGTYAGARD